MLDSAPYEQINAQIGRAGPPATLEVERGAIRYFCEAVGDLNPLYLDEGIAVASPFGGVIAPPLFLVNWHFRLANRPSLDSRLGRPLNAGSIYEFFCPVRPGDAVTTVCRISDVFERKGRSGGLLFVVFEADYRNQRDEPAARCCQTMVYRREAVWSGPRKPRDREEDPVGQPIPRLVKGPISRRQLVQWAGASGDFNEVHYDDEFARREGLPGVVVTGSLKLAFMCQVVTDWLGTDGRVTSISATYRGLDFPQDVLTCRGVIVGRAEEAGSERARLRLWVENQRGEHNTYGSASVEFFSR